MKKCRRSINAVSQSDCLLKILRIMKLTMIMFLVATLQTFAEGVYSQNTELTLNLGETNVGQALTEIENQSEFYFLFNQKLVDTERKVLIQVSGEKIEKVLDQVFAGTNTDYFVSDRQIVLAPKEFLAEMKSSLEAKSPQQEKTITGTISDPDGKPLPGVSVSIKGSFIGTITNAEGKYFLLEVPDNAETLLVSYIGMISQEITIGTQTSIDVTMENDEYGIEEVVVIGYGQKKKENLLGAVSAISSADLGNQSMTSASQAISGRVAGVQIIQGSSHPGKDNPVIQIRGIGTIRSSISGQNSDSSPLVIVDGIQSTMNDVHPEDIESISVLKDASSAAIYGARAANGVILITTKGEN